VCIPLPGRVVEVDRLGAVVAIGGRRRRASSVLLPDVSVGDWVAVLAGTIVDRLEPDEAAEIEAILGATTGLEPPAAEDRMRHDPSAGRVEKVGGDQADCRTVRA
jgi:hydrogenase assembly chaperone HypC/HupF